MVTIHWFRQDLRLADNPALYEAATSGDVLPIYIMDDTCPAHYKPGAASSWWLHNSLASLNETLDGKLVIYHGDPLVIIEQLISKHAVKAVHWNRCYEPWRLQQEKALEEQLRQKNISFKSFNGSLLWEPWDICKKDGTPYKVYTPFYQRGCLEASPPRMPLPAPKKLSLVSDASGITINELALRPTIPWDKALAPHWSIGEQGARTRWNAFCDSGLANYKKGRDFPASKSVSRLSPHLHFGEISPHQLWNSIMHQEGDENTEHFCKELAWREFSYYLLYHFPTLTNENLQPQFDRFPWNNDEKLLSLWQQGKTGYPMVDAGMRELWQTGYMHNRIRMIVGSFLVKNLLLDWRLGERWFYDCLVDADIANNCASWQWVAGCGMDAAPYFRIFNPITQGKKFDPEGEYIRQYVPELRRLPSQFLFSPWEAPDTVLAEAGVELGKDYPFPLVDIKASRQRALDSYHQLKEKKHDE